MFDVVVVGSGPAGYVSAIRCSQLGLKTLCIEESHSDSGKPNFGGTCLNVGCIPSKALLDSSHRYYEANKKLSDHGIQIESLKLDLKSMMKRKDDIVGKLTGGISGLFSANKVESMIGRGKVIDTNIVEVTKPDGSTETIDAKNIIVATGSKPIEIPSAKFSKHIVDSTGALCLNSVPKKLGVVGAGIIGLELGSVWSRLGSEVTVIEALDEFLPMTDHDISKETLKEFKKQGLDIKLGSKVTSTKELKNSVKVKFESNDQDSNIYTKEGLLSHLMVLLGGRIAEELFYGYSVTSGAKQDLQQAYELAKTMIINYGMGEKNIYPDLSLSLIHI